MKPTGIQGVSSNNAYDAVDKIGCLVYD